jgi:hypothetical protein
MWNPLKTTIPRWQAAVKASINGLKGIWMGASVLFTSYSQAGFSSPAVRRQY